MPGTVAISFVLNPEHWPEKGRHHVQLFADGRLVCQTTFEVRQPGESDRYMNQAVSVEVPYQDFLELTSSRISISVDGVHGDLEEVVREGFQQFVEGVKQVCSTPAKTPPN